MTVRLYSGFIQPGVLHEIGDYVECAFPGYERLELLPEKPQRFVVDEFGYLVSEMLIWQYDWLAEGSATIRGYVVVAEYPDGHEEVVTWENFKAPITFNADAIAFGMVIGLAAVYLVVSRL